MSDRSVAEKLRLKSGMRAAILWAPAGYAERLEGQLPTDVRVAHALDDAPFDFILAFATQREELLQGGPAWRQALEPNGVLWVSYPKGKALQTDLNRDIVRTTVQQVGLDTVSQVAIDDTWSALRLKPT
jgi:hypothetical protein